MKEIHFYKDKSQYFLYPEDYSRTCLSHNETVDAINNNDEFISTFALSALDFGWLLDLGYDIYLHENDKSLKIQEGSIEATDKEIRKGHNIMKMWIAGVFEDYFYEQP